MGQSLAILNKIILLLFNQGDLQCVYYLPYYYS